MDEMLIFKEQKNYKEHSVDILNGSLNKYELAIGVIELRRTLHHNFSERCFA